MTPYPLKIWSLRQTRGGSHTFWSQRVRLLRCFPYEGQVCNFPTFGRNISIECNFREILFHCLALSFERPLGGLVQGYLLDQSVGEQPHRTANLAFRASPLVLAIKRAFALTSNLDFTKIEPEFYDLRRRSRLSFQQAKRLAPHFILPGRGRLS
jgi:hypothetical protein